MTHVKLCNAHRRDLTCMWYQVVTKDVTSRYICIIFVANMNVKYSVVANMDINIWSPPIWIHSIRRRQYGYTSDSTFMNAWTYDSINAYAQQQIINNHINLFQYMHTHPKLPPIECKSFTNQLREHKVQNYIFWKIQTINHITTFIKLNTQLS